MSIIKMSQKPKFSKEANHDDFLKGRLIDVINDPKKSYHEILMYIQNEINESTRIIEFNYKVRCFLEDGAYQLSRAVEAVNGFTTQKNTGPSKDNPPEMLDVRFADGSREKVPFGAINLPSFGEGAFIDMDYDANNQILRLSGQCEKRYVKLMDEIVEETQRLLAMDSIYKGRAIKIVTEGKSPEFINLHTVDKTPLFLTPEAKFATQPIEARIERTEECIKQGIDLKFGVLLEGNYGTGKSLYAFKLALKAVQNEWSFVYCPDPRKVLYVMKVADMLSRNGKGVVLFIEDVDKVLHERTNATNEISLLMDGGESKNKNIITVLTTNHIEKIDPTFLRGKRIGSIVTLSYPDKDTAQQMIEAYLVDDRGRSILSESCEEAAEEIENNKIVPAFIAEILDRVKSNLIYSGKKTVSCDDIINSIKSYKKQMEIATVRIDNKTKEQKLVEAVKDVFVQQDTKAETVALIQQMFKKAGFNV